jgi:hypothetical protein
MQGCSILPTQQQQQQHLVPSCELQNHHQQQQHLVPSCQLENQQQQQQQVLMPS